MKNLNFRNTSVTGFTLLELLLGFSIFAMTAVTLYAVFSNGVRINGRADKDGQLYRELLWTMDRMTLDLENMVNYEGYREEFGSFHGSEKMFSLAAPTDSGLKIIRYSLQSPERGTVSRTVIGEHTTKNKTILINYSEKEDIEFLVREEISFFASGQTNEESQGDPDILSTHVQPDSLRFTYGAQEKKEGEAGEIIWKNEWSDVHLPAAVRVELSLLDSENPDEPLIVRKEIFIPTGSWGPGAEPAL